MSQNQMKAALWVGGWEFSVEDRLIPPIETDEVLIAVSYVGICVSDLHVVEWGILPPPLILGHEFSGTVFDFGEQVKGFNKGDKVVAHPQGPCGECYYCREGLEHFCTAPYSNAFSMKGAFAEYVAVKAKQAYRLPDRTSLDEAALMEPLAIALHSVDRSDLKTGQRVLIIGGGTIGLLVAQLAKISGAAEVMVSTRSSYKREAALKMGADRVLDPLNENLVEIVDEVTEGRGLDICFEAVGSSKVIEEGFSLLGKQGRLIVVGTPPKDSTITINPFRLFYQEAEIRGSFFSPYSFQRAVQLLPRLNLKPMITHCFDLSEVRQAMDVMKNQDRIKVLLKP